MAYAEKRGKGPRPWRVKYKIPGGEASESGFETKQSALDWGRDHEAKVRAGTWMDPSAGEITVSEWIDRWLTVQDVGLNTEENREYHIRRFIRPYWGTRPLNSITGEEIASWERKLPGAERVSRTTAKSARGLFHTILGDAVAAKPPLILFNPAVRPRNRGRRTGRSLDRTPARVWATPLEVLLVAERAALLAGRDEEFTMLVTIGYTGMRWGETIGLEHNPLLPRHINVEWQLSETKGRFHRQAPKDDDYRTTNRDPRLPVDLPSFLSVLLTAQANSHTHRCACAARHDGSGRYVFLGPDGRSSPVQQLCPAHLPPGLRRAVPGRERETGQAGGGRHHGVARKPSRGMAASCPPSGRSPRPRDEGRHDWSAPTTPGAARRAGTQSSCGRTGRSSPTRPAISSAPAPASYPPRTLPWPAGCRSNPG